MKFVIQKENKFAAYLLFLVSPIASLIFSVINYRSKYSQTILFLFCGFFGFTFVISSQGLDSAVYRRWFENAYKNENISFFSYVFSDESTDYFINFINYTLSRFTGDYRLLFMTFGLIYGYFYSKNIYSLIKNSTNRLSYYSIGALLLFIFLVPFWNINGIRFYLATHIFYYAVSRYYSESDKRYLLLVFLTYFIHFSFGILISLFIIYILIGRYRVLYLILIMAALFVVNMNLNLIVANLPVISGVLGEKIKGYTMEEFVESMLLAKQNASWFLYLRQDILNYAVLIYSTYLIIAKNRVLKFLKIDHFIKLGIIFITTGIIFDILPAMGRLMIVGHLFSAAGIFYYLNIQNKDYWSSKFIPILTVIYIFFIVVEIRIGMEVIGPGTFLTNPLIAGFFEYTSCFADYYKGR